MKERLTTFALATGALALFYALLFRNHRPIARSRICP